MLYRNRKNLGKILYVMRIVVYSGIGNMNVNEKNAIYSGIGSNINVNEENTVYLGKGRNLEANNAVYSGMVRNLEANNAVYSGMVRKYYLIQKCNARSTAKNAIYCTTWNLDERKKGASF